MRDMPTDPDAPTFPGRISPRRAVGEMLARVAAERGLCFEPALASVIDALPGLTRLVEDVAARCHDAQQRRWLAAALAALSHHVQASTLTELAQPDHAHAPGPTSAAHRAALSDAQFAPLCWLGPSPGR
jgi:hypothetical protein